MQPDITVVVPAYNVGRYIEACLRSLVAQSYGGWTCVVVDDGSLDDTALRVGQVEDPRIQLVGQANAGVSAARNRGLFGALRKVLADGRPYPGEKPLEAVVYPSGDVLAAMVRENFLANGGHVLARTEAAKAAGGFDTRLRLSEDWEFWCRLALQGAFQFIGAPPEVFSLRMTPGSASGGLAADWNNHRPAVEMVLQNRDIAARFTPRAWRRLSRQVWASHQWEAGRVNFTCRKFGAARRLMAGSLAKDPRARRAILFVLAQASQLANRSLVSRLRFRSDDESAVR